MITALKRDINKYIKSRKNVRINRADVIRNNNTNNNSVKKSVKINTDKNSKKIIINKNTESVDSDKTIEPDTTEIVDNFTESKPSLKTKPKTKTENNIFNKTNSGSNICNKHVNTSVNVSEYVPNNSSINILNSNVDAEIDSYLVGLENRYTDKTRYKLCNKMYAIGLDISATSYTDKPYTENEIAEIMERSIDLCMNVINNNTKHSLEEIKIYNKKQLLEYIKRGAVDGLSSEYNDTYKKIYNNEYDKTNSNNVSDHLNVIFSKYTDTADFKDLEQFYNVGILMANKPYNKEKMILKLKQIIDKRSKDDVPEIAKKKRKKMLESMNKGFGDSMDKSIRDAYDLNGKYNYDQNKSNLMKRARIDAVLKRSNR
jgi:hypothetical protein